MADPRDLQRGLLLRLGDRQNIYPSPVPQQMAPTDMSLRDRMSAGLLNMMGDNTDPVARRRAQSLMTAMDFGPGIAVGAVDLLDAQNAYEQGNMAEAAIGTGTGLLSIVPGGRKFADITGEALLSLRKSAINGDKKALSELVNYENLPEDRVLYRAQNAVNRYGGQTQEDYVSGLLDRRPEKLGQTTEERMQRAEDQNYSGPYYTGASRMDRLLEKGEILPERATSGPMPFFTNDPELASSYAKNKADTSLEMNNSKDAFTVNPKAFNLPENKQLTVEDAWKYLSPDKKAEIINKATRIGYEDKANAEGKIILHPKGVNALPSSKDHFDYIMKTEAKGNPLAALRELWLDSGNLYDEEEIMGNIYKLTGFPEEISQINAPWTEASGVLPAMIRMQNPLDTLDTKSLQESVIPSLQKAFKDPKYNVKAQDYGVDQWDKNFRFTPKQWVDQLAEDVKKGENSYVWTSIPDEVTKQLEKLGYDSIIDVSGKGGGDIKEKVIIPFKPNQVRSINAEFDPEKADSADLLSSTYNSGILRNIA